MAVCAGYLACLPAAFTQTSSKDPVAELQTSLQQDKLDGEDLAAAITKAFQLQADESIPWDNRWGNFLQLAREKGKLSDDQWRTYLSQAVRGVTIRVASQVKRGAGLPIFIEQNYARTGGKPVAVKAIGVRQDDLSGIALKGPPFSRKEAMNLSSFSGGGFGWTEDLTDERYAALKPGPQTYHYRYEVTITGGAGPDGKPVTIGQRVIEGRIPWRLLADNESRTPPTLQPDPTLRPALEKAFRVQYVIRDDRDKTLTQVMIQVDKPPVGMAFDMSLRAGGDTWLLGPVGWARSKIGWWAFDLDLPEGIKRVDVVLKPSAQAAVALAESSDRHRLSDLETIWDGPEIVIPAVAVRSQRIKMIKIRPPAKPEAVAYALAQMEPADPVVQQWKTDADSARARAQLEQQLTARPGGATALYELGCILTADGELPGAMKRFVEARAAEPPATLTRQIQRQQRRLCAMWLSLADPQNAQTAADPAAMAALGAAYEHGWGAGVDLQEAKRWYLNAANAGNAEAMCRLASLYEHKSGATVPAEQGDEWYRTQTLEWYRKAATLGNAEAKQWITTHDH